MGLSCGESPSTRRAWIEIGRSGCLGLGKLRSPSTRRAWIEMPVGRVGNSPPAMVALHPEGVDRNSVEQVRPLTLSDVALHPEGVDRNLAVHLARRDTRRTSPSTRRAWIEISPSRYSSYLLLSPSTRRAWIEIPDAFYYGTPHTNCRPPPGGRG